MTQPVAADAQQIDAAVDDTDDATQQPTTVDWEAEAKKWQKRSKDNYAKLKEAEPKLAEYEQIKAASQTEAERQAQELTRWQTEAERWRKAAVGNRIQALASVDFEDPNDAALVLTDLDKYLDAGGQIDEDAIRADLADVLERKPKWRRSQDTPTGPRLPAPNPAQGAGGGRANGPADEFAALIQRQLR